MKIDIANWTFFSESVIQGTVDLIACGLSIPLARAYSRGGIMFATLGIVGIICICGPFLPFGTFFIVSRKKFLTQSPTSCLAYFSTL